MAEYITKEAAIQVFEWGDADVIEDYGDGYNFGFSRGIIKSAINAIPTADVAPVVRCENCAFSQLDGWICAGTDLMPQHRTFPNSFCSDGEIKDGGNDDADD